MGKMEYKTYTKTQMIEIIKKEGFLFVETNLGDNYIIRGLSRFYYIRSPKNRTCC